jgi:hypothetical protein
MQKTPTIAHFTFPPPLFNAHFPRILHVTTCFTHHYFTSCHAASSAYRQPTVSLPSALLLLSYKIISFLILNCFYFFLEMDGSSVLKE